MPISKSTCSFLKWPNLAGSATTHIALAAGLALVSFAVYGQQPPNIGNILHEIEPAKVPVTPAPALPEIENLPSKQRATDSLKSGTPITIKHFQISGNQAISTPVLLNLVQSSEGKTLSFAQIEEIAARLTRFYRDQGYFVARVYVPQQDVTSGVVQLKVVEGRYGEFLLKNTSLVNDSTAQSLLDDIKHRDMISFNTIERAMLIMNDTPGVQVSRAEVMPGKQVGTSDFAIDTIARSAQNGYVVLDNYGSAYTGKERLSFNYDWNSPTHRGDRLSFSGKLTNHANLRNGQISYNALLAPNGTRGELSYSQVNYELGDIYEPLDALGHARTLTATVTTPFKRTQEQTLEGSLAFYGKDLSDEIRSLQTSIPKRLYAVTAGLSTRTEHPIFGSNGVTQANANLTIGQLDFRDSISEALDKAGSNTQGSFYKIQAEVNRLTQLPRGFNFSAAAKIQVALNNKSLDSSERMSISGYDAVTAYPSGELSGDHAALMHLELTHPISALASLTGSSWNAGPFVNYGWVKLLHSTSPTDSRELSDVGLVLNVRTSNAFLKAQLAHRTSGAPTSESFPTNKLLLQAGWMF